MGRRTKKETIARFLQNCELPTENAVSAKKTVVRFDGRKYTVLESDVPYYETLLSDLSEWHPYPAEKPKTDRVVCFVTRTFRGESYTDEAFWITKKKDVCFEEDWEGPGFYKEIDGETFKIDVIAWMTKPEPYKEVDRKKVN